MRQANIENRILQKGIQSKKWSEVITLDEENAPTVSDCCICLAVYSADDDVYKLECNRNHVYHKSCFI